MTVNFSVMDFEVFRATKDCDRMSDSNKKQPKSQRGFEIRPVSVTHRHK